MRFDSFLKKAISFLFALLFFLVPLFFTQYNSELFEFNKIILVYFFAILIAGAWLGRMILQRKILFKRTPLDLPLLLFFISQFLSLLLSIDRHTSLFGYYSRFNGGLLSTLSYLSLYWALVSNCEAKDVYRLVKVSFISALIVSVYGILEHFGHSFSCLMFTNRFDVNCWVQDVQTRVFATLGQPNWLAAYLAVLIPAATFYLLRAKDKRSFAYYLVLNTLFFSCLLFTGSRSGFLGLAFALAVFWVFTFIKPGKESKSHLRPFLILNTLYLILVVLFGSPFSQLNRYLPFKQKAVSVAAESGPALEVGGTESGKIRQIVWKGALNIFKRYPVFGSGVETFAYSYYNFRPVEHNLVSEWDFLYNKAHNEYLNYLSTTGIIGLGTYLIFIVIFIFITVRQFTIYNLKFPILALFSGWLSILISNFFGFSVVLVSLYFYLIPAFIFALSSPAVSPYSQSLPLTLKRKVLLFVLLLATFYLILATINLWRADYYYSQGLKLGKQSQYLEAYQFLAKAAEISPGEPVFLSELSSATTNLALLASVQKEATTAGEFSQQAINFSDHALRVSPRNLNLWKTRIKVFYSLSAIEPKYLLGAIEGLQTAIKLAPTDPKLLYNLGLLYGKDNQIGKALETIQEALVLKPNYEEARQALSIFYEDLGEKDKAIEQLKIILLAKPNDADLKARLEKLQK